MIENNLPAAGYYPDPEQAGASRYWDGTSWAPATPPAAAMVAGGFAPPEAAGVAVAVAAGAAPRTARRWVLAGGIATVVSWIVVLVSSPIGLGPSFLSGSSGWSPSGSCGVATTDGTGAVRSCWRASDMSVVM